MAITLLFRGTAGTPPAHGLVLLFGEIFASTGTVGVAVSGRISIRGSIAVDYDGAIRRTVAASVRAPWIEHSAMPARHAAAPWADSQAVPAPTLRVPWIDAAARPGPSVRAPWSDSPQISAQTRTLWNEAGKVGSPNIGVPWSDTAKVGSPNIHSPWAAAARLGSRVVIAPWGDGMLTPHAHRLPWRDGALGLRVVRNAWRDGPAHIGRFRAPWQYGPLVTSQGSPWEPPGPGVTPPHESIVLHFCGLGPTIDPHSIPIIFGLDPCYDPGSPPVGQVIVPIQRVYIVINNTHLFKVAGMVELPTLGMTLSLDVNSWTWGFSATLPADQLAHVTPAGDGTPVVLAAVINGVTYHMIAEGIQRDRSFNVATIRISGRGRSALLDAPYAVTQSFSNATARTAAQLLDDALTLNGVAIGWTVDTQVDDWLVPGGVWNHNGSHITALQSVAQAGGGYLQPTPALDHVRVFARYPLAPWDWGSVTPDFVLPADVVTQEGIQWAEKARYNRVFVSGQGDGILGQVTRFGTAGDMVAPMITDPLITEAAAARQRGKNVLSDTGRVAMVSLRLPVLLSTGIIPPGKFVRYVDGATTRLGLVRSVSVDVAHPEVWQTIGVETHE